MTSRKSRSRSRSIPPQKTTTLDVLNHFSEVLNSSPDMTPPIAAIKTLVELVTQSKATTYNELHTVLSAAVALLQKGHKHAISASAGCTLFIRFALKTFAKAHNFDHTKQLLVSRGLDFVQSIDSFRDKIANVGNPFIQDDAVILVHSYSRVVMRVLQRAAADNKRFTVYVTESRPSDSGVRTVDSLRKRGIPAHLLLDSAVGYILSKVDLVLVGAEGVVETGGIVNHIGTYQIAMVAKEKDVPVYAVAESYKFVRLFPLDQYDLGIEESVGILCDTPCHLDIHPPPNEESAARVLAPSIPVSPREAVHPREIATGTEIVQEMERTNPVLDYTPPKYITLLLTDKGALAPSAVSDELIKVFL